jgi:hypothetical protein
VDEVHLPPDPGTASPSNPSPAPSPAAVAAPSVAPDALVPSPTEPPPQHADRSTGLVIFGVFQIILGLLTALLIPLVALSAFVSRLAPGGGGLRLTHLLSALATYGFCAAALVALGIGSIQARRWARALTVIASWYWLIVGTLITILVTAILPVAMRSALEAQRNLGNAPSADVPTGLMAVIITLVIAFMAFFLIAVPIAFLVFYSRADVAATCRDRDPVERWTDRAPLPVLGASVIFFVGALYCVLVGFTIPVFPFFGRYLTGFRGTACFLLLGAIDLYLAIGTFRLRIAAWWIAVVALSVRILSMVLTYLRADLMQAYAQMGLSEAQLSTINSNPVLRTHVMLWWGVLALMIFLGYLLVIRRYFKTAAPASVPMPAS